MLYASTKATFKKEFGQNQIKEEVYANMREDVSLAGYLRHERAGAAPAPLSREEEEMLEIKQKEVGGSYNIDLHITQTCRSVWISAWTQSIRPSTPSHSPSRKNCSMVWTATGGKAPITSRLP